MTREVAVRVAPGEALFRAGDAIDSLYLVKEGALELRCDAEDGTAVPVRRIEREGSLVVEAGASFARRAATVVAATQAVLVRVAVDESGLPGLIGARPAFGLTLARSLAHSIYEGSEGLHAQSGRVTRLIDPVDESCRAFHRIYAGLKKVFRASGELAVVLGRIDSSPLGLHAKSLPAEGGLRGRLRQIPRIGTEELERAGFKAEGNRFKTLPPGYEMCREGEVAHDFFFLFRGRMEAMVGGIKVGTIEAGEFAGEMTVLLEKDVRTASLFTIENCRIMVIERSGFEPLLTREPPLLVQLVRSLARRQEAVDVEVANLRRRLECLKVDLSTAPGGFLATIDELVEALGRSAHPAARGPLAELQRLRAVLGNRAEGL